MTKIPEDLRITTTIAREYGGCTEGWKSFCKLNNLDFQEFLKKGILAKDLLATGDVNAKKLVEFAITKERL